MKTNPRLKMLVGYAGRDFSLMPGEETERFSAQEAKRLIRAEHAVKVDPPQPKKPATKQEWDEERARLLDENTTLKAQLETVTAERDAMSERNAALLMAGMVLGDVMGLVVPEHAVAAPAPETRG